jgi:hypothetical protein
MADCQQTERDGRSMLRNLSGLIAIAALLLSTTTVFAAPAPAKRHVARRWHGYGFLPGYRSPERIEWERAQNRAPGYWYGGPGFYRGRWTGGGFGPCWTETPIGEVWNCGR